MKPSWKRSGLFGAMLILSLAGCETVTTPDLHKQVSPPQKWRESSTQNTPISAQAWWIHFRDPALTRIIEKALASSPDKAIALARVAQARALERGTVADQLPRLDTYSQISRSRRSETRNDNFRSSNTYSSLFEAGFDASWEVDVFGTIPAIEAAEANSAAEQAAYRHALVTLTGEVARQYFALRKLDADQGYVKQKIATLDELIKVAQADVKGGRVTEQTLVAYEQQRADQQAELARLDGDVAEAFYTLEALVGEDPGALRRVMTSPYALPVPSVEYALASPAAILSERADVAAAEKRVMYYAKRKEVALAQYFPSLNLSTMLGLESGRISTLSNSGSRALSAGVGLTGPLFDFGRIRADAESEQASLDEALATYEKTVRTALAEVESATARFAKEKKRLQELQQAQGKATDAYELLQARNEAGVAIYSELLEAQLREIDAEQRVSQSVIQGHTYLIQLYKAIGGGIV